MASEEILPGTLVRYEETTSCRISRRSRSSCRRRCLPARPWSATASGSRRPRWEIDPPAPPAKTQESAPAPSASVPAPETVLSTRRIAVFALTGSGSPGC